MELLSSNVEGGHLDLLQNFLHSEVQLEIHTILLLQKFPIIFYCWKVQRFIIVIIWQAAGQFLDLSVITGDGVRDECHLLVLAAYSPVFAACSPGPNSCLLLPDFTSADFLNLLGVLYGGPTRLVSPSPIFQSLLLLFFKGGVKMFNVLTISPVGLVITGEM